MSASKVLKLITGILEAILGIPVLGGSIVISLFWIPLPIMFVLHIITLIITRKEGGKFVGSILGIVTSCVGWIPVVGMIMHIISAIFLIMNAVQRDQNSTLAS